jgi:hypothetical protein
MHGQADVSHGHLLSIDVRAVEEVASSPAPNVTGPGANPEPAHRQTAARPVQAGVPTGPRACRLGTNCGRLVGPRSGCAQSCFVERELSAPLVRLVAYPRGPINPRGWPPGRSLAADVPSRLWPPLRRVRPRKREPAEAVIAGRACKLVPLSYLASAANRREAARRAENPYSGISQSGNQRVTSSSNGSSDPSWAFRRSSRSESRALSPLAGTNG